MVRHSEDWWGVLRQGIELENMARAEQGWAGTGRVFIGRPRQGTEIELENMGRLGAARSGPATARIGAGVVSLGQDSPGMEIELENRECCGLQRLDLVGSGKSWVGLGAVVLGMEIKTIK